MKKFSIIIISLLLSCSAYAGLYRWVDDKGNVFYSDKIPPVAAKHGHIELNQRGLRKKKRLSLVQIKEIETIRQQRIEEYKEKQKRDKVSALKKMQDEQLLAIYSTREELISVFKSKIIMSKGATKSLKERHQILSARLAKTEIKHEKMKNPAFKQTILKKIDDMLDGLKVYQQAITENIIELDKLEERFTTDLGRFDSLVLKKKLADGGVDTLKVSENLKEAVAEKALSKKLEKELKTVSKGNASMDISKIFKKLQKAIMVR
ncbi:MAG: DUF4124 domain-containing protein [Cocleimonas sp.]|nr:DUF4124 domain-containing protein [Cocleimonas sp.]